MSPSDGQRRGLGARIARTLVFSAGGQIVGLAQQVVLVPFFLRAWGDGTYGDWLAATAVASYLGLADMGVQSYAVNRLSQDHARGDDAGFRRDLHSTYVLYALLALAGAVVLGLLAALLPWEAWFDGHAIGPVDAGRIATIAGAGVLVSIATGFAASLHKAYGDAARSAAAGTLARLLTIAVTVAALWVRLGPVAVALAVLASQFLAALASTWDLVRLHPEARPSFHDARRETVRAFLAPSLMFLLVQVAYGLTVQGTVIVASVALGGAAATTFATARTLVNVVRQAVQLLGNSLWPEFTRLHSTGDARLPVLHRLLVKGTSLVTAALVPALATMGPTLYGLWTGGRVTVDATLLHWLLLGVALQAPWLASSVLLAATNRHGGLSILYVVQGLLVVGLSAIMAPRLGTAAMGIALATTDFAVFGVLVPRWAQAVTGERLGAYLRGIYVPYAALLAVTTAASAGAWWLVTDGPLLARLLVPPVVTGAVTLAGAAAWLSADERRRLDPLLSRLRRRAAPAES
jgi:O-antigen/teichoic acid export membrane protein